MDVKEFIGRQRWTFAKTYAKKAPHEYIVRGRINGTDAEFLEFRDYILNEGMTMYYWGHPNKYVYIDGYSYWVMRDSEDDPTTIIKRCVAEDYIYSIRWKGLENVGNV